MANPQHIAWLREGPASWKARRRQAPFDPDLSSVDLSRELGGHERDDVRQISVHLGDVNLSGANLTDSTLRDTDLTGAALFRTDFTRATLTRIRSVPINGCGHTFQGRHTAFDEIRRGTILRLQLLTPWGSMRSPPRRFAPGSSPFPPRGQSLWEARCDPEVAVDGAWWRKSYVT